MQYQIQEEIYYFNFGMIIFTTGEIIQLWRRAKADQQKYSDTYLLHVNKYLTFKW